MSDDEVEDFKSIATKNSKITKSKFKAFIKEYLKKDFDTLGPAMISMNIEAFIRKHETNYVRFTEENEWEGETWHFYIQISGNEREILKFEKMLEAKNQEKYSIDTGETFVKREIEEFENTTSYLDTHNILKGKFTCPEKLSLSSLYKGGIRDFSS